jgi:hypothetical protein
VATIDLCEGFCKPYGISIYACESTGECFFNHRGERDHHRPPLCYRVMGNHCYPDPLRAKTLSSIRDAYTNRRGLGFRV